MITDIADILPNTPSRIRRELQGTEDYPYVIISSLRSREGRTIIVPRGKSVKELGDCIRVQCENCPNQKGFLLTIPDRYGLAAVEYIGQRFLTLLTVDQLSHVCIYNLEPRFSSALCFYLTGEFIPANIVMIEMILSLQPGTIGSNSISQQHVLRMQQVIQRNIQSDKAIC